MFDQCLESHCQLVPSVKSIVSVSARSHVRSYKHRSCHKCCRAIASVLAHQLFSLYVQGTLFGARLPVLMEIIMLECQKFVFVGCGFMLCTSLCSSLSPLIKPHLASSLSKTCISFASTLLFVLHLVIILSFITLQLYTSQHQFQSLYTPQL